MVPFSFPPILSSFPSSFHNSSNYCQLVLTSTCGTYQYCLTSTHSPQQTEAQVQPLLAAVIVTIAMDAIAVYQQARRMEDSKTSREEPKGEEKKKQHCARVR